MSYVGLTETEMARYWDFKSTQWTEVPVIREVSFDPQRHFLILRTPGARCSGLSFWLKLANSGERPQLQEPGVASLNLTLSRFAVDWEPDEPRQS